MASNYHEILAEVALRINALTGVTAADQQTAYTTRPLTTTQWQSPIFPFASAKAAILNAEERLAHAIANVGDHPWRKFLADTTTAISHKGLINTTTLSKQIIGMYGAVYDASDGTECTKKSPETIRRRVRNANSFFRAPAYYYCIEGNRIFHTRTTVTIDVCVYDRASQSTNLDANSAMLLPDVLDEALVAGAVSMLVRDDEFTGQAAIYRAYFNDTLKMIAGGGTSRPNPVKT